MDYILIFIMCVLATAKMSFQSAFGKRAVKNSADALVFNIFVFIVSAMLFLPKLFGCSAAVWVYGAFGAVCAVAYQLLYTKALSIGNVSLTAMISNFSMVINVLVSYMFFDEPISLMRLFGIALTVTSFVICNSGGEKSGVDKKWLIMAVLAMFATSAGSIVQKMLGESPYKAENQAFISCLYLLSALIGVLIYPLLKKGEKLNLKINFGMIKYAVAVGVSLALYQWVYTYGLANIDGTFLFPSLSGGTIVLSTLSGVIIFKDKFTNRQKIGVIIGIISLILMNF
ncbi:MAG: EamA family transporter [Clostridia bacterium]|nr:EamA family transporter [Clostridia bacterium]